MKVYILTRADLDVLIDSSLRDQFRQLLEAPAVFSTQAAACQGAQEEVNEVWDDLSLGEPPVMQWQLDPSEEQTWTCDVLDGELSFRITEKEVSS